MSKQLTEAGDERRIGPRREHASSRHVTDADRWQRSMDLRIGIVPLPIFVLLIAVIVGFVVTNTPASSRLPSDVLMNIATLAVGGFACADIGRRLPFLHKIGSGAVLATFVPSYLVYAHLLPQAVVQSIRDFTKQSNFLYLFITAIIVGSILGMDRRTLISGFLKIFVPMATASLAAVLVGALAGVAVGLDLRRAMFFVVLPVLGGGVGEGAIPLSISYAALSAEDAGGPFAHMDQGAYFAQILPAVMMGSLFAIVLSGLLDLLGRRHPVLTGNGRLQADTTADVTVSSTPQVGDPATIAAAGVTAVALFLVGALVQRLTQFPAPITMLVLAVLLKLGRLVSPGLEGGAFALYRFFSVAVTYPLLFAIGASVTPWDKLVAAFTLQNVVTIGATVATLVGVGFGTGRLMRLFPIDTAIITACRAAQGGTGDVAILTACDRMALMPFAQIATRIGGALTVALTIMAFKYGR